MFCERIEQQVMGQAIEASRYIALDIPRHSGPTLVNVFEGSMASSLWTETMRVIGEARLEVSVQNETKHFLQQLVRPGGQAQSAFLGTVPLGNVHAPDRFPLIAFLAK